MSVRNGLIDLVQARGAGAEFRLGRYFIEHGLVTTEDIDRILRDNALTPRPPPPESGAPAAAMPPSRKRSRRRRARSLLGDLLVDSGRVTHDQLRDALARQSSELVYEVLRWPRGSLRVPPRTDAGARGERAARAPRRVGGHGGVPPRRRMARRGGGSRQLRVGPAGRRGRHRSRGRRAPGQARAATARDDRRRVHGARDHRAEPHVELRRVQGALPACSRLVSSDAARRDAAARRGSPSETPGRRGGVLAPRGRASSASCPPPWPFASPHRRA